MTRIAVLGAGAWGTAMACHLVARAAARPDVVLWGRDRGQIEALRNSGENAKYLAGTRLPSELALTNELHVALHGAELLLAAVPMAALAGLATDAVRDGAGAPLVWLAKGFVTDRSLAAGVGLAHEVIGRIWPSAIGVVSGPSFAEEVAQGLPTALAVAATAPGLAAETARLLRGDTMRAYVSDDLAGVEVGGAVKNVLAIAAGASDGLGFGHNARAALVTRGLAETGRLSLALGGQRETLMGLAGLGDLMVRLVVVKAQPTTVFFVEPTQYGWSVRDGAKRLGLFVSQRHALDDVRKRQAALKAKGRASSVEVTGEETEGTRGRYSYARR